MPLLEKRNLADTRSALTTWLAARFDPTARVVDVAAPAESGFSSETLLVSVERDGQPNQELVFRIEQQRFRVVREVSLEAEVRLLGQLHRQSVLPVPEVLAYEPDSTVLGAPFFVMPRLPGRSPGDQPPYHEAGWLADAQPEERRRLWLAGVDHVAELHRVDPQLIEPVNRPGLPALLDRLADQQAWAPEADLPETGAARDWLMAHQPAETAEPVVLWGDARLGNLLFADGRVTGMLDWEKSLIGPAEIDLAWFLYVDRHHSEGCRLPRLAGLPDAGETIERYQQRSGRTVRDLRYFELLSAYHFALLMCRAVSLMIRFQLMPEEVAEGYVRNNSSTTLLRRVLEEVG